MNRKLILNNRGVMRETSPLHSFGGEVHPNHNQQMAVNVVVVNRPSAVALFWCDVISSEIYNVLLVQTNRNIF